MSSRNSNMILRRTSRALRSRTCSSYGNHSKQRLRRLATAATSEIYDVAVVGGGPAGLSLLTALRASEPTSHLRLALIETQSLDDVRHWQLPKDNFSNRASSLTPASIDFLSRIGAWDHVDQSRIQAYEHMRVWDGLSTTGRISFDSPASGSAIAYMTENQNLTRALTKRLHETKGVDIFDKTSVAGIQLVPSPREDQSTRLDLSTYPHIQLSNKRTLAARLLVGADGLNSPVRKFAGIPTRGWDYDRHGVVATLKLAPADTMNTTAYQRFLPTGPVALLALPNNYATLVWTTTPARAAHLKSLSSADFLASVNAAFRLSMVDIDYMSTLSSGQVDEYTWRLSVNGLSFKTAETNQDIPSEVETVQEGSIASFPLRLRHASTYTRPRVALIGDAAHTIHPLAGQGLNMGLSDSRALASTIEHAVGHGADIGDELQCLDGYTAGAWMANNRMLGAVDKLHWLYSARAGPIVGVRGLGLGLVDRLGDVSGLKGWFMRQAGGL